MKRQAGLMKLPIVPWQRREDVSDFGADFGGPRAAADGVTERYCLWYGVEGANELEGPVGRARVSGEEGRAGPGWRGGCHDGHDAQIRHLWPMLHQDKCN